VTVALDTENRLHLSSSIKSWVNIRNDSSTKFLADWVKDRNIEPAPDNPAPVIYQFCKK
jgi:hypothetical protein